MPASDQEIVDGVGTAFNNEAKDNDEVTVFGPTAVDSVRVVHVQVKRTVVVPVVLAVGEELPAVNRKAVRAAEGMAALLSV